METGASKTFVILAGEIKTPPMSREARREAGVLIRLLQKGQLFGLPHSRPMPSIGPRCHELRIQDENKTWRIMYRIDADEILILEVFAKDSKKTPKAVLDVCKRRLRKWDKQ